MVKRFPPEAVSTVCIPWKEDFSFDADVFERLVQAEIDAGLKVIYLFGTAGEGYALSREQFCEITECFMKIMGRASAKREGLIPMVGIIELSTSELCERIRLAMTYGVRYFQISFPSWGALTDEEVDLFFHQVCDQFPTCEFMHYNNGGRSKKLLRAKDYKRLADQIPNLAAVKFMNDSFQDIIDVIRADLPIQFILSEYGYGYGSMMGECGLLFSNVSMHYPTAWELYHLGQKQEKDGHDVRRIMEIEKEVAVTQEILFATCPRPVMNAAYDKVYFKRALDELSLRLYPPYCSISEEEYAAFVREMQNWLPNWI